MSTKFLLVTLIVFFFSCPHKVAGQSINDSIVGEWRLCKRGYGEGNFIVSNICTTIIIEKAGTGYLFVGSLPILEGTQICRFEWKIKRHKINFYTNPEDEMCPYFIDTKFDYKLYYKENLQYLELIHHEKDYIYYLIRERLDSE